MEHFFHLFSICPIFLFFVNIMLLFSCICPFTLIFVDIILLFFAYVHLPAHKKNQELSLLIFLYNNHLISAKNSRSILFGKYSGEDPAAIPHTSFNPYFFAICFARNT